MAPSSAGDEGVGPVAIELDELLVDDAAGWREWLLEHHATSAGVWLALHKKGGSVTGLTYVQAVEEALCFGWIDGQARRRDEGSSFIRMTRRRPRSPWSASNVERVARLEAEGRMQEAGRAAVRSAQADGRWAAAATPRGDAPSGPPSSTPSGTPPDTAEPAPLDG